MLCGTGVEPVVIDTRCLKLIADSKKKSDRRDARTLAEMLKGGLAENSSESVPSERARRARSLMRTRQLVVKQAGATLRAARSLLDSVGVSISKRDWTEETRWEKIHQNQLRETIWYFKFLMKFSIKIQGS